MKNLLKYCLIVAIASTAFTFVGCEGEDGDPGVDGVGFAEAVKYGSITVMYSGTRPDEVAFQDTVEYRFSPTGGNDLYEFSRASVSDPSNEEFEARRYYGTIDDVYQENYIGFEYNRTIEGVTPEFPFSDFEVLTNITTNDFKFFSLSDNYAGNIESSDVSEYSYTPATGSLKFKLNFSVPAESNGSNHDLTVSVTVDVKVFQNIGNDEGGE